LCYKVPTASQIIKGFIVQPSSAAFKNKVSRCRLVAAYAL